MHKSVSNLVSIQNELKSRYNLNSQPNIIAVTKTFSIDMVRPLIEHGHTHYGENKVQEAVTKWTNLKKNNKNLKLHMIGKLQTNKVKYVVPLFDYIHSLDSIKLAEKIAYEQKKNDKRLKIFIQVNIGDENQKSGISKFELDNFYNDCINNFDLNIVGLMCIPPANEDISLYFSSMNELKKKLNLKELSMGMSSDYLVAIKHGATFIRVGSKIFGNRS